MRHYLAVCFFLSAAAIPGTAYRLNAAEDLALRLAGRILLQVEANGEAWYVYPSDRKRYYLGRPDDAFTIMRSLGAGIAENDLKKFAVGLLSSDRADADSDGLYDRLETALGTNPEKNDTDGDGYGDRDEVANGYDPNGEGALPIDAGFAALNAGLIFIDTGRNGEAWYVDPGDKRRYYLGRPDDAFAVMRLRSLGIKNNDLEKISIGRITIPDPIEPPCPDCQPDAYKILSQTASAIRANDIDGAVNNFVPDYQYTARKTLEYLDPEGRLTLGNILSSTVLSSTSDNYKIFSTEVYFSGQKHKINFPMKIQADGSWRLEHL